MPDDKLPSPPPKRRRKPKVAPPPDSPYPVGHPERTHPVHTQVARLRAIAEGETLAGAINSQRLYLRHMAAIYYSTSRRDIAIADLAKIPPFNAVSLKELKAWATEDNWVIRREQYFTALGRDIEDRIRKHVSEVKVRQLQQIDYLFDKLARAADSTQPKSLEGLAVAIVRLLEAGNALRDQIAGPAAEAAGGGSGDGSDPGDSTDGMTDDQVREVALAVAQQRHKAQLSVPAPPVAEPVGEGHDAEEE